jgi:uncharacterized damage-inducible protein DinB
MSPERVRPPLVADERTQLMGWFDLQRAIIAFKCEGLSHADAHRAVLPTSPLMTVAGIVSHLRWTEHCWFEVVFLHRGEEQNPQFTEGSRDLDWMVDDVPLDQLLSEYQQQCATSDATIAAHCLEDVAVQDDSDTWAPSLRWMILHMVEETARHAGHLDTIRELLDGQKGYY